jgi:hypothetical protein
MTPRLILAPSLCCALLLACGCGEPPATPDGEGATAHAHAGAPLDASLSTDVQKRVADLRRWTAPFHDLGKAADAGYTFNIGCIDETIDGVTPVDARGMGYHVTRGDKDIVGDGIVDIDEPEFLVYAPHPEDADLPKSDRLKRARLVALDYFVPGGLWTDPQPPEFFGQPFHWSNTFQGWVRHIYLWGHNPDGMFSNYNPAVGLCTELLSP